MTSSEFSIWIERYGKQVLFKWTRARRFLNCKAFILQSNRRCLKEFKIHFIHLRVVCFAFIFFCENRKQWIKIQMFVKHQEVVRTLVMLQTWSRFYLMCFIFRFSNEPERKQSFRTSSSPRQPRCTRFVFIAERIFI